MQLQLSKAMSPNSRLFKSELTARDHTELDRMLQAQRRFEEDLVRKTKQYE